tara:strand:+ start:3065 stop:4924 length:1860 start_codon:yes stop_codon:yes gene_type:complete
MFRRNKNKLLARHINRDYDNVRNDVDDIQDTVDNDSIMNIINPAHISLDMNNNNIDNVGLINGGNILVNPISNHLETNNFKIQNTGSQYINLLPFNNELVSAGDTNIISQSIYFRSPVNSFDNNNVDGINNLTISNDINMPFGTGEIKMNTSNISNVGGISMSGVLDFQNSNGILGCPLITGDTNNEIKFSNNTLKDVGEINNSGVLNINSGVYIQSDSKVYVKDFNNCIYVKDESDFPNPISSGIYIICDFIQLTSPLLIDGDCTFFGLSRNRSGLIFNVPTQSSGYCIVNVDYDVSFQNLIISNQSNQYDLLFCNNIAQDKIMTYNNVYFYNCKNTTVMNVSGFDLLDMLNCLFMYNYPSNHNLLLDGISKVQITSCEFLRQQNQVNSVFSNASMISLNNTMGALNITSCLFHPQDSQHGIDIQNSYSSIQSLISSNTFIDVGLFTGSLINYNGTINLYPSLIVSDNTGVRNEKALLEGQSIGNTTYTSTTAGVWNPVDFGTGFTVPVINRFEPTLNPFEFQYKAKQPISCMVNVNITADHDTKGDDTVLFGLSQNGTIISQIQTDIKDGADKTFGFNTLLQLVENDLLQFKCQNLTSGTDTDGFRATGFNGSLVEV